MGDPPPKQPKLSQKGRETRREREARQAEALRANLQKRKSQARGRAGAAAERASGPGDGGEA